MDFKTAYEMLKVDAKAPLSSITKAYRKLALKLHPDKCKEPNAQEKFTQLQKAYEFAKKNSDKNSSPLAQGMVGSYV